MTINPVDMQVLIPQIGQVNKIQRALQNQQQTEQQIIGQLIHDEMNKKEHAVKTMNQIEKKKIEDKNPGTKEQKQNEKKHHEETICFEETSESVDRQGLEQNKFIGRNFDIKV